MKRHRPSIRRAELGEAWHRSAGYAMSDRLVKRQHAALGRTGAIGEINRSRLQQGSSRTISMSIRTVASGTGARVDPRATSKIRCNERCGRDWIGGQEGVGERVRLRRDPVGGSLIGDASREALGRLL